jgi:signal transduction histidine kinase
MDTARSSPRPWAPAALVTLVTACVLGAVAVVTMGFVVRENAVRTAEALRVESARVAAAIDGRPVALVRREVADLGVAARVIGPRGQVVADGPLAALWDAGAAPPGARAAVWRSGATVGAGVVESARQLDDGRVLVMRAPLAMGTAGILAGGYGLAALISVISLGAGAIAWRRTRVLAERVDRRAEALVAVAGGRSHPREAAADGPPWDRLDAAIVQVAERAGELRVATEARMEALGATLAPMPVPAAARTPTGGVVRNDALERLVGEASHGDAALVDDGVRRALAGPGAMSRRIELDDGRVLELEAWAVPGGRVVVLGERTEQARLRDLRASISGAAARKLRGPLGQIREEADGLAARLPAPESTSARAILAAVERLDRLTARMLRGGSDETTRMPVVRPVGVGAVAFGLGQAYDRRLRERGLRLEHDIPEGIAPVMAEPGLLHEALAELIDNASAATPRGGVITLRARDGRAGRIEITIADTGSGIPALEQALVAEPFGRGTAASIRPGAGLGLGVARSLVERMGGRLALEAGPGGVARVELPAHVPAPAPLDRDGDGGDALIPAGAGARA